MKYEASNEVMIRVTLKGYARANGSDVEHNPHILDYDAILTETEAFLYSHEDK